MTLDAPESTFVCAKAGSFVLKRYCCVFDSLYSLPAKTISQFMEEAGGVSRVQERQHSPRVPAGRSQLAVVQLVQQVTIIKPAVNIVCIVSRIFTH